MFLRFPLFLAALNFLAATTGAHPTWKLAIYEFRCKAPNIVESYTWDWGDWRISSICHPGYCCSNKVASGPLCTVEACVAAEEERYKTLKATNAIIDAKKKQDQDEKEAFFGTPEGEAMSREKEAEWKQVEAKEAAALAKLLEVERKEMEELREAQLV